MHDTPQRQSVRKEQCPSRETLIREMAYLKWEQAGRPEGLADFFWREAEHDVPRRDASEAIAAVVRLKPRRPALYMTFLRRVATVCALSLSWIAGPSVHYSS